MIANVDQKSLVYICCLRRYGEAGCKKNKHKAAPDPSDNPDKYLPKLNYLKHHM